MRQKVCVFALTCALGVPALAFGAAPLVVVDSMGTVVGPVVDFVRDGLTAPHSPTVMIRYQDHVVLMNTSAASVTLFSTLRFEFADCTGRAVLYLPPGSAVSNLATMTGFAYGKGPSNGIFAAPANGSNSPFGTALSFWGVGDCIPQTYDVSGSDWFEATYLFSFGADLTPPFSLKANPLAFCDGFESATTSCWTDAQP